MAQRLVRVVCPECKMVVEPPDRDALRAQMGMEPPDTLLVGQGCRECQDTGYRGRTGIFEVMAVDEDIRTLILEGASAGELRKSARRNGMSSLREDGWRLVMDKKTTVEEVLRVTKDERMDRRARDREKDTSEPLMTE